MYHRTTSNKLRVDVGVAKSGMVRLQLKANGLRSVDSTNSTNSTDSTDSTGRGTHCTNTSFSSINCEILWMKQCIIYLYIKSYIHVIYSSRPLQGWAMTAPLTQAAGKAHYLGVCTPSLPSISVAFPKIVTYIPDHYCVLENRQHSTLGNLFWRMNAMTVPISNMHFNVKTHYPDDSYTEINEGFPERECQ